MDLVVLIVFASVQAMTPLLIAGVGELVVEKSGVLNLGIEGMMIVGSITGFIVTFHSGNHLLAFLLAILAGMLMALLFAFVVLKCYANQVVSGLALTMLGLGLSAFLGLDYQGKSIVGLEAINMPFLADIPFLGKMFFQFDFIVYFSIVLIVLCYYFLYKTKMGLVVRAVGEDQDSAHKMGLNIIKVRFITILFGGACAGLAGAYISLVYIPLWSEGMTAGKGWIVLALVVFSSWLPKRLLIGSLLFGFISIIQLFMQGDSRINLNIPGEFFSMLPYLSTILILLIISRKISQQKTDVPGSLGLSFKK